MAGASMSSPSPPPGNNPLDRFDVTALWDEEQEGGSLLSELLVVVQEELDQLERDDDLVQRAAEADVFGDFREITSDKKRREQQLDRYLEQHSFSHKNIESTVARLQMVSTQLEQQQQIDDSLYPNEPDEFDDVD